MTKIVVPDVAESLLAFRVWRWDRGVPLALWSLNAIPPKRPRQNALVRQLLANPEGTWPVDGPLIAKCDRGDKKGKPHQPPGKDCTCGIYAAYDVNIVAGYVREARVMGLVQASGRVIPADNGLRAEKVRIACLFNIASEFTIPHRDLKRLADGYGVPLVRPYSARPDEYRKDVRDGFSRFKKEEKR